MTHPNLMARAGPYLLALAVGAALLAWLMPPGEIFPTDPYARAFYGDSAQSVIGQRYFLGEAWSWPLLVAHRLGWPEGTNVAFTDSLPLALLPLKLARAWLPRGFIFQEGWLVIAWLLQPVAAVFALRGAGQPGLTGSLAVAVLSLMLPSLLLRFAMMSLCTHGVILIAIGLYFRLVAAPRRGLWAAVPALLLACLLIHPYLLAMDAAVLAGAPLTLLLRRDRQWRRGAAWLAGGLGLAWGVSVLLGYGHAEPAEGFGFYAMNLLSPMVPGASSLFGPRLPDPTGGQWVEGDQYLGAGVLLLGAAAVVTGRGAVMPALRRHTGLAAALAALFALALSNRVYAGSMLLWDWGVTPAVLRQFRASGRFFWPVAYVILVGSVAILGRLRTGRAAPLLLIAVMLQVADTRGSLASIWLSLRHPATWVIDTGRLRPVLARHDQLTIWPVFGCGANTDSDPRFMQVLQLASETLMRTNTMYTARRIGNTPCDAATTLGAPWQPHEMRVILPPATPGDRWFVPDSARNCRPFDSFVVCAPDDPALAALTATAAPVLPLGETVTAQSALGQSLLGAGWSPMEPDGAWSDGPQASLRFSPPEGSALLALTLQVDAIAAGADAQQAVQLCIDDVPVAAWSLPDLRPATLHATIAAGATVALTLQIGHPVRPDERGLGADHRRLGIKLHSLRIDPA